MSRESLKDRFDRYTVPEPNSGCLLWLGCPTGQLGHPQMKINGRNRMASHVALELAGRSLPEGMFACHHCDNPSCVNVDHLFVGTQHDNVADALSKGRQNISGLRLGGGHNKLPAELRLEAQRLYRQGFGMTMVARLMGRPVSTIQAWFREFGHIPRYQRPRHAR